MHKIDNTLTKEDLSHAIHRKLGIAAIAFRLLDIIKNMLQPLLVVKMTSFLIAFGSVNNTLDTNVIWMLILRKIILTPMFLN